MAICNIFKKLTKETGTFLTFGQYMDDLTEWQTKSKFHKIVPSKFIAIDDRSKYYTNSTLPRFFQEFFENACACYKNDKNIEWNPEYAKILFWNSMFKSGIITKIEKDETDYNIDGIKYVGDINIQSFNEVDGMGYSEIYCNIPNEAASYIYSMRRGKPINVNVNRIIRHTGDFLEGMREDELNGLERLEIITPSAADKEAYEYLLDQYYDFSWDRTDIDGVKYKTDETQYNINIIVLLYDIWNDSEVIYSGVPLGMYITGLIDNSGNIQNSITKYVSNEDIYNSGTSYGIRICSRYVASPIEDNYIIKEVTCENNNNADLSRALTQMSISQNKMDEIVNKKYNTDQNYKQLLSIFKNSRTNTPYIKQVNDSNYWYINGKMVGPSINLEGLFEPYTIDELEKLYNDKCIQAFLINVNVFDSKGDIRYIFEKGKTEDVIIKWNVNYNGINIKPSYFEISENGNIYEDYTRFNNFNTSLSNDTSYMFKAYYANYEATKYINIKFVHPVYFGELPESCGIINSLGHDDKISEQIIQNNIIKLPKYITDEYVSSYEITTIDQLNPGHVCYAYPQIEDEKGGLNELSFIVDDNGFILYKQSNDSSVNKDNRYICKKDVIINGVKYIVYVEKEPAVRINQILHFKMLKNEENK